MKRNAFTLIELMVVVLIIGLLIAILLPSLGAAMESGRRAQCLANLSGFGKALTIYKSNNNGVFPMIANATKADGTAGTAQACDTQASLWLLVASGGSSPDAFVCPTDKLAGGVVTFSGTKSSTVPFPLVDPTGVVNATASANTKRCYSYSYQIPNGFNTKGSPSADNANATKFAIMADRAPFTEAAGLTAGLALAEITAADWKTAGAAVAKLQGVTSDKKQLLNSPNHRGEGQNVLFQDGHAGWRGNPWCGINDDNIYTVANGAYSSTDNTPLLKGVEPDPDGAAIPYSDDDSVLCNINQGKLCTSADLDGH
ncbi:MAG: type II secretion system protein [Phycisphaerae bacterium]|nr:type II secretion system protein [Phycisphaerae bacterium]